MIGMVALSFVMAVSLEPGHPLRIVGGLALFVALPGLGLELALFRSNGPTASWERLAVIGALGLAASGLASVVLVVFAIPLTEVSVGAACGAIAVASSLVSVIARTSPHGRRNHGATLKLALLLALIVTGGLIGSQVGQNERQDPFTILAFEDHRAARAALERGVPTAVRVIVESHEAGVSDYQLVVVGGIRSAPFNLRPAERRVLDLEVAGGADASLEIQLLKSGLPYRSLRLTLGDQSRSEKQHLIT